VVLDPGKWTRSQSQKNDENVKGFQSKETHLTTGGKEMRKMDERTASGQIIAYQFRGGFTPRAGMAIGGQETQETCGFQWEGWQNLF